MLTAMLALSQNAYALNLASPTDLVLKTSVKFPKSGETFRVEARSFAFDLTRANVDWFLNGKLVASGRGLRVQEFTATRLGSVMNIETAAISETGVEYEASLFAAINDVDLILHPLTYAPAFYRGSPLPTPGSIVEITALPHVFPASPAGGRNGVRVSAANLIYEWKIDNIFLGNESGGGKNKLTLALADVSGSDYIVSVKVSLPAGQVGLPDNNVAAEKSVRVQTVNPEILFYRTNSLTGILPSAFSSLKISAGEKIAVSAEPYFFDLVSLAKAAFSWLADGAPLKDIKNPRVLELESQAGSDSQGAFNLKIEDKKTIFQNAEANLSITSSL